MILVATGVPDVSARVATSLANVRLRLPTEAETGSSLIFHVPVSGRVKSQKSSPINEHEV